VARLVSLATSSVSAETITGSLIGPIASSSIARTSAFVG
jgi:hypothetical protein